MKYNKILISAAVVTLATACADTDLLPFGPAEKPGIIGQYEYLNDYDALKTYVDRSANPGFMLGSAISVADYTSQGIVYRVTNANFDEVVAGNAMKMASCVDGENGSMSFDNVSSFVNEACEAGLNVYGHTLAWHSQQPVKWLNKLIKDNELEIAPDAMDETVIHECDYANHSSYPWYRMSDLPQVENGILTITNTEAQDNWQVQYFIDDQVPTEIGGDYVLRVEMRGSSDGTLNCNVGDWGGSTSCTVEFTTEWETQDFKVKGVPAASSFVVFQSGAFVGTIEIKKVQLIKQEAKAVEMEQEVKCRTYEDGPFPFYAMGCEPPVINGCIHFVPTGDWSQFFILPGGENTLDEGDYVVYLDITSSKDASGVQLTMQNGWGGDAQNISAAVPITAGQQVCKLKFPGIVGGSYDVIFKPQTADAVLDIKSITICKVVKLNSIPLTPEEKKDTLVWAMDRWIGGMMQACEGKVKAWDVVNEAISGGNADAEGVYALQHADNVSAEDAQNNFYWQDYLGDLDYVRTAVASARKHFAEIGGDAGELKLFVNDYNLESDWDHNGKLKSLIKWIERWEADGVTKIDGIGSQMHISCYEDPATQESKKNAVEESFRLMAQSGKLVRISELDMGYIDASGKSVTTKDITFEQKMAMSELYKFVISKYLEIVPVQQRYGICQWAQTDSPEDSGWRPGEPIGLWDSNYSRKPAYGGFADGLQGK